MALHPPLSAGPAGLAGAAWAEHLLLLRNAFATGLHQAICACLCWSAWMWSQQVCPYTTIPSYLAVSCRLAWSGRQALLI